jgi:hypothetical protein
VTGPITVGALMDLFGPSAFFLYIGALLLTVCLYGLWRMTRRPARPVADSKPFTALSPSAQQVAVTAAQESAVGRRATAPGGGEGTDLAAS